MHILKRAHTIHVDLKALSDKPGPYCMSFAFDLQPLIRSIQISGLINSPIVTKGPGGRAHVVVGYRRILALKQLQWEKAPCRDLSGTEVSPLQLLLFNLYDNLATRKFNDVEKAMILNRLIQHVPREEILRHYMGLLELPSHEPTLEVFLGLERLDQAMKESVVYARISFQTIKALMEMTPETRSTFFHWMETLKFNTNQQTNFIAYTTDISMREKKDISQLLKEEQFLDLLDNKKLNNPQKIKLLFNILKLRRFPLLSRSEKIFQARVQAMKLPEGTRVQHPPFFEGSEYRLEIPFKSGKQLKKKVDALKSTTGFESLDDPWPEEEI